jgi:hypothetical protein
MRAADFPLFLAYAAYPLAAHAQRAFGDGVFRNWIDAAWVAAGLAAVLALLALDRLDMSRAGAYLAAALLGAFALAAAARFGPQLGRGVALTPWLMELKPLFYLAVSLAWFAAFGPPRPEAFVRWGVVLALILTAEFAAASLAAGKALRPEGSGEINYDACLVLISLATGLYSGKLSRLVLALLFLGLAASFSRTALGAAAALFVFAPGRGIAFRSAFAAASACLILVSFQVRGLPVDAVQQLDRLCMWSAGIELMLEHPWRALAGFAPGIPLPVDAPAGLEALWAQQQRAWDLSGVFAYNLHSFWLRIASTWGLVALFCLLAGLSYVFVRCGDGPVRGLTILVCLMGLTMGLVYLSNVAVPLYLACLGAACGRFAPEAE